jgi:TRAP transporter TAXI family solute receptor
MNARDIEKFWGWLTFFAMGAVLLGAAVLIYLTLPPRTVVMATGAEGGTNYQLGMRYRDILAKAGVRLELRATTGSMENLALLRDPRSRVDVGFLQNGTTTKEESPTVESLGTISYEPLWLFIRSDIGNDIQALRGRRVSIGPEGSGGRMLALDLIKRTRVDTIVREFLDLPPMAAAEQLIAGQIDAALIVTGWDSPVVQRLINTKGIDLGSFRRSDALVAFYPFLNKLVLPAGVGDLLENRPAADVMLLAPKASLVVKADLHSAIQHLLLSAAVEIHSQPGIFQKAGQFPTAESIDLPLSDEALRYYKHGRTLLEKYLPFWLAALVERIIVVFLPIAVLVYPFIKFLPQMYDWFMQSKITRLYDEMRSIEGEMNERGPSPDIADAHSKLDRIDASANSLRLPNKYTSTLYTLRGHLNLVRTRLAQSSGQKAGED